MGMLNFAISLSQSLHFKVGIYTGERGLAVKGLKRFPNPFKLSLRYEVIFKCLVFIVTLTENLKLMYIDEKIIFNFLLALSSCCNIQQTITITKTHVLDHFVVTSEKELMIINS